MRDENDWSQGLRLIAVAVASAVITATLVISAGGAALDHIRGEAESASPALIHING